MYWCGAPRGADGRSPAAKPVPGHSCPPCARATLLVVIEHGGRTHRSGCGGRASAGDRPSLTDGLPSGTELPVTCPVPGPFCRLRINTDRAVCVRYELAFDNYS